MLEMEDILDLIEGITTGEINGDSDKGSEGSTE